MKTISLKVLTLIILFCCLNSIHVVAGDVPLKKDNPVPGGVEIQSANSISSMSKSTSASTQSSFPVSAEISTTELSVFFSNPVGIAVVRIEDQFGTTVCQTAVDTYVDSELYIPVDSLKAGQYKVKISYGSTSLVGEFEL